MEINLNKLSEPLKDSDIELRVGNVFGYNNQFGMSILAYKTARVDRSRLDEAVGPLNWKNEYFYDSKGILCCKISIYCSDKKEWVSKEDVGTESYTEKEKGSYSDAFKRAGFKWGIGTELYNMTDIVIFNVNPKDIKSTTKGNRTVYSYKKTLRKWKLKRNGEDVVIFDDNNKQVFPSNNNSFNQTPKQQNKLEQNKAGYDMITKEQSSELYNIFNQTGQPYNKFVDWLKETFKMNIYNIEGIPLNGFETVKGKLLDKLAAKNG